MTTLFIISLITSIIIFFSYKKYKKNKEQIEFEKNENAVNTMMLRLLLDENS